MQLPEPQIGLWNAYQDHEIQKVRSEALPALQRFVESVIHLDKEVLHNWALDLSRRIVDDSEDIAVRFPLFRTVLFPALLAAISEHRPGAARWLAGFCQLLYQSPECQSQLPEANRTEIGLLRTAILLDRNDRLARRKLIQALAYQLEYAIHEVPAGVLWGNDGASVRQCEELSEELEEFSNLAECENLQEQYRELIDECQIHFNAYPQYLSDRKGTSSYAEYLSEFHDF